MRASPGKNQREVIINRLANHNHLKCRTDARQLLPRERVSSCVFGIRASHSMFKRRKTGKTMWINPHSNLTCRRMEWDRRETDANNARYLELADVALNPGKSNSKKAAVAQESPTQQVKP
jgi:hypothetical protein